MKGTATGRAARQEAAASLDRLAAHLEVTVGHGAAEELPPASDLEFTTLLEVLERHDVAPGAFFAVAFRPAPDPGPPGAPPDPEEKRESAATIASDE